MTRPKYCPNCGTLLTDEYSAEAISSTMENRPGYDCYCSACEWSGDIWPDDESEGPNDSSIDTHNG